MMRIIIFVFTNFAVMLFIGLFLSISGVYPHHVMGMMISACLIGFGGSFFSLIFSQWIALRSVNGRIIEVPNNATESWLINTIKNQVDQIGIVMPKVAIYPAYNINAFATGAKKNESLIAVSSGLLQYMTHDEVEAVLAHELAHIYNGDMVTMTLIQGVLNTFVIFISNALAIVITKILSNMLIPNEDSKNPKHIRTSATIHTTISTALSTMLGACASMITMWFSRKREFYADAGAARIVGINKMIAALERLKTSYEPQEPKNIITLCINGKNNALCELFMSHPSIEKRIDALRGKYIY
ncbi:protease HtpX [Candidatus Pantoea edessiphila]|uniref:Protease HtpX n=1 Tax=Candidatus Pantoea edessiphila TaxID=2044610 RepID=A0A2P5SYM0_9GAMM|nr:protease HtpX [Candidatus Pantoea edessiphila]MBK4775434.1 protease HtpX [Pantoea sp. Edef]PPI87437.1 protease HtpX [Candidatus Pantoea edessiphila]